MKCQIRQQVNGRWGDLYSVHRLIKEEFGIWTPFIVSHQVEHDFLTGLCLMYGKDPAMVLLDGRDKNNTGYPPTHLPTVTGAEPMKVVITLASVAFNEMDVDTLLRIYGRFFYIHTPDTYSRDWLEGYALMTGHRISLLCGDQPAPDNRGVVSVTFPELELPL